MKKCTKCNQEKDISNFGNRKNNAKKIILNSICRECLKIKSQKFREKNITNEYDKKRYLEKKEEYKTYQKEYYKKNKEKILFNQKEKYSKDYQKEYYQDNKERILKMNNENKKLRLKNDILYRLTHNIKCNITRSFKRKSIKKTSITIKILGCSFEEFKIYIESKFEYWMNWENYGLYNGELNYGWDIDHIIPISSAKTEEDVINLNNFNNFQPLCSKTNRDIKKNNII